MSQIGKPPCDSGVILGAATAASCTAASQRWVLLAAILGSSMAFIDGTVVNVALPAMERELGASTADAQWVMESYALFLASLLLVGGVLGDRYGRRRIFMIGTGLFTLASVACACSTTVLPLVVSRALQGIGAALLVPGSLALISANFAASQRGTAIGTWSACSGITAAIGPVIGGFLVDHYSWIWAFLVNAPVGAVLLWICARKVPESHGDVSGSIDVRGAVLVTLGLAGVVFALIEAPSRGWSDGMVWMAGALGVLFLLWFVREEARSADPMLPLALFRERNFAGANVLTLLLYAALGGSLFFLPLNLIQVQGYGATAAGAALLPFIAIMFALSRWAGSLVDRFGSRPPLIVGPLIAAAGFALFAWPSVGGSYWLAFFPAICTLGLGMSITVAPLTTTVMNAVDAERAGTASGVNNAVSRTGPLLAIALFGMLLTFSFNDSLEHRLTALRVPPALADSMRAQREKLAGIVLPPDRPGVSTAPIRRAIELSFVDGFRRVMLLSALLALLSAVSAAVWIRGGPTRQDTPGH